MILAKKGCDALDQRRNCADTEICARLSALQVSIFGPANPSRRSSVFPLDRLSVTAATMPAATAEVAHATQLRGFQQSDFRVERDSVGKEQLLEPLVLFE